MGYKVQVKYFNSFWNKKIMEKQVNLPNNPGQPKWPGLPWNPSFTPSNSGTPISYPTFPANYQGNQSQTGWTNYYVEESRYKGGFNNSGITLGVRAYAITESREMQDRSSSLIYSGVLNTRTYYNNTNVFSIADAITKDLNPQNGSIQKLYTENTNLMVFQQNKTGYILLNKNAIYSGSQGSAEGGGITFLGQLVPFAGEYGISSNPESFAFYGYRKYFADKYRGVMCRVSGDGITEISGYGMNDFFRDNLAKLKDNFQTRTISPTVGPFSTASGQTELTAVTVQNVSIEEVDLGSIIDIKITNKDSGAVEAEYSGNVKFTNKSGSDLIVHLLPNLTGLTQSTQYKAEVNISSVYRDKVLAAWDIHNKFYTVSLQTLPRHFSTASDTFSTLSYEERVPQGGAWTSFYTYKPSMMVSLKDSFYSIIDKSLYKHYYRDLTTLDEDRGNFYGVKEPSSITFIFNQNPTTVKNFNTLSYEGSNGWEVESMVSDWEGIESDGPFPSSTPLSFSQDTQYRDSARAVKSYIEGAYQDGGITFRSGFDRKENKYVANIVNNSPQRPNEIIYGSDVSGIKGYFTTIKMKTDATTQPGGEKELFSVATNFVISSN